MDRRSCMSLQNRRLIVLPCHPVVVRWTTNTVDNTRCREAWSIGMGRENRVGAAVKSALSDEQIEVINPDHHRLAQIALDRLHNDRLKSRT